MKTTEIWEVFVLDKRGYVHREIIAHLSEAPSKEALSELQAKRQLEGYRGKLRCSKVRGLVEDGNLYRLSVNPVCKISTLSKLLSNAEKAKLGESIHEKIVNAKLKTYQNEHTKVFGAQIRYISESVDNGDARLFFGYGSNEGNLQVSMKYMRKHNPDINGYYVLRADGTEFYYSADAFESIFTEVKKAENETA
jgi:hypothetical protein